MRFKEVILKKLLWMIFAILLLPVCTNAMDFYNDGWITDGNNFDIVNIWNSANVTMTGGYVASCYLYDTAILNYADGGIYGLATYENSIVNVHSNYGTNYLLHDASKIFLHNGSAEHTIIMEFDNIFQLHIYGYGLIYLPKPHSGADLIEGYWEDNSLQNFHIRVRYDARVNPQDNIFLHEIPEPATIVLMIMGVFLSRRRR